MAGQPIPDFDLYDELEVSRLASTETIAAAYRSLAKRNHPDRGGTSDARMRRINLAAEWLTDPARRARYDEARSTFPDGIGRGASPAAASESTADASSPATPRRAQAEESATPPEAVAPQPLPGGRRAATVPLVLASILLLSAGILGVAAYRNDAGVAAAPPASLSAVASPQSKPRTPAPGTLTPTPSLRDTQRPTPAGTPAKTARVPQVVRLYVDGVPGHDGEVLAGTLQVTRVTPGGRAWFVPRCDACGQLLVTFSLVVDDGLEALGLPASYCFPAKGQLVAIGKGGDLAYTTGTVRDPEKRDPRDWETCYAPGTLVVRHAVFDTPPGFELKRIDVQAQFGDFERVWP